jgi:hypothetical protein
MIRIVTLAGALALFATTSASAQYAYLPPGYCGYDAYGGLIPCGYDYGSPFFFGGPFFGFPGSRHRAESGFTLRGTDRERLCGGG